MRSKGRMPPYGGNFVKRVYHHFSKCEEFTGGMWRKVSGKEREKLLQAAADLMKDSTAFKVAMIQAVEQWPYSCEQNLTASSINHKAWMGHAGCCIAINSPEEVTRLAWHTLTEDEQDKANAVADEAIEIWRSGYESWKREQCQSDQLELMF